MTEHTVYLSLGSNIGNRADYLSRAIERIKELVGDVVRQSAFYDSEPWGFETEHRFLNAAIKVNTVLKPMELLRATQRIERELGRTEKSALSDGSNDSMPRYHDRTIDIDILLYDDCIIDEPGLRVPHPLMWRRDFVMQPLREVAWAEDEKNVR